MPPPTGTVTLLFSDIESSTRLWEQAPKEMAEAVERHDTVMRAVMASEDGYVFKTVGDEFCVAFATVPAAIAAAVAAQHTLVAQPWPAPVALQVRMALHAGACQERDNDYFGPTVNRAARLMAVGWGGQVLVSGATAELLGDGAPSDVSLRDLGLHRLRDLGRPEHVHQLVAEGLRAEFPPLRSLDNPELPNNLPALLSGFVGRGRELSEVRGLVRESRLVTLTGAGGAGKTRLAVQAAAELLDGSGDGVWFVELASISDPEQIPLAVASAIGLQEGLEVDPGGALLKALGPQRSLFVIDNCEHLVDGVAKLVDAVMRSCAGVHVIATSREPLGVDGERVYRVPSMSVPSDEVDSFEEAQAFDAVALFASRAADAGAVIPDHDVPLVASVCRRLDGIPLALELAAARLASMSLAHLSDRLDQRFRLLTGGSRSAMARQQTLQATVEWSYGLLHATERSLLRRLSVFVGGFELEAAEQVCVGGDVDEFDVLNLLHSLVEKSLVVAEQDAGSVRYRLLETIRQYAAAELLREGGDEGVLEARDRHAAYVLDLAARSSPELEGAGQVAVYTRLDLEIDNVRAALTHLSDQRRAHEILELVVFLQRFFRSRVFVEVIPKIYAALDDVPDVDDELVGRARLAAGMLSGWLQTSIRDEVLRGEAQVRRACEIAERTGPASFEALAWGIFAMFQQYHQDLEGCASSLCRALELAEAAGDPVVRDEVWDFSLQRRPVAACGLSVDDRLGRATSLLESARSRGDLAGVGRAYSHLASLYLDLEAFERAIDMYTESIAIQEELGDKHASAGRLNNLALAHLQLRRFDEADVAMRRAIRLNRRTGLLSPAGDMVFVGGCVAVARGEAARGARLLSAADELRRPAYETGQLYLTPGEVRAQHEAEDAARASLGQEAYERERDRGRRLSVLEALALALEPSPDPAPTAS